MPGLNVVVRSALFECIRGWPYVYRMGTRYSILPSIYI